MNLQAQLQKRALLIDELYAVVEKNEGKDLRSMPTEYAALLKKASEVNAITKEVVKENPKTKIPEIDLDGPAGTVQGRLEAIRQLIEKPIDDMKGMQPDTANRTRSSRHMGETRMYSPSETMEKPEFSIGRLARALADRQYADDLNDEERAILNQGQDSLGGVLVPNMLSNAILEPLRARSLIAANSKTVIMPNLNITMAGVETDATVSAKRETKAFDEASIDFSALTLTGHKVGAYVKVSEEILHAPNAIQLIEDSLLDAVSQKVDYYIAHGGASAAEPTGIQNTAGIYSNTGIGAGSFATFSAEIYDLLNNNVRPPLQAFIAMNVAGMIDNVQDAVNKHYATPANLPKSWNDLNKFESGILNDGTVIIGDFRRYCYVAFQGNWRISATPVASDSDTNGFVDGVQFIRILGWMDVGLGQPGAFQYLDGLTSITDLA